MRDEGNRCIVVPLKKRDSANQLNPVLLALEQLSEAHDDAGREANSVLVKAEQVGGDVVALKAPGDGADDAIVEAAAGSGGEGSVGDEAVDVGVAEAELEFGEGAKL